MDEQHRKSKSEEELQNEVETLISETENNLYSDLSELQSDSIILLNREETFAQYVQALQRMFSNRSLEFNNKADSLAEVINTVQILTQLFYNTGRSSEKIQTLRENNQYAQTDTDNRLKNLHTNLLGKIANFCRFSFKQMYQKIGYLMYGINDVSGLSVFEKGLILEFQEDLSKKIGDIVSSVKNHQNPINVQIKLGNYSLKLAFEHSDDDGIFASLIDDHRNPETIRQQLKAFVSEYTGKEVNLVRSVVITDTVVRSNEYLGEKKDDLYHLLKLRKD